MAVRNQNWYNLNESRDYPLDDKATAISDDDDRIPQNVIADIRVRWPEWAGQYAFLGSVAVTPGLVTVTVLASSNLSNDDSSYIPIAVSSVTLSSLEEGRQYAMESMYPGAFGYIVYGSGISAAYSGRFKSPLQSLLSPRSCRPHSGLPIKGLGKLYDRVALTGMVNLAAEEPFQITKEVRTISGDTKEVVVFSVIAEVGTLADTSLSESILQSLAGECGKRPESGTCGCPEPIEYVNSVSPDCNGVLTFEFKGCAIIGRNTTLTSDGKTDNSMVIDCGSSISDTCEPPFLPTMAGFLPSEKQPIPPETPVPPEPPVPDPESVNTPFESPIILPYCETFTDQVADYFADVGSVVEGGISAWLFNNDISPQDICRDASISESEVDASYSYSTVTVTGATSHNMSVWAPGSTEDPPVEDQTIYRTYTTDLKIVSTDLPNDIPNPSSVLKNGGILVNYRALEETTGGRTFWLAELDADNDGSFNIKYFNGVTWEILQSYTNYTLYTDVWYRIKLEVKQEEMTAENRNIILTANLTGPIASWDPGPPVPDVSITLTHSIPVSTYLDDSGKAGLHTYKSTTQFSAWKVEDNRT